MRSDRIFRATKRTSKQTSEKFSGGSRLLPDSFLAAVCSRFGPHRSAVSFCVSGTDNRRRGLARRRKTYRKYGYDSRAGGGAERKRRGQTVGFSFIIKLNCVYSDGRVMIAKSAAFPLEREYLEATDRRR